MGRIRQEFPACVLRTIVQYVFPSSYMKMIIWVLLYMSLYKTLQ